MIQVSNDWINAHKQRLLPEGEIRISVYSGELFTSANLLGTITRKELINFFYKSRVSIVGKETYSVEAIIDIFDTNTSNFDFPTKSYCLVEIGFNINGSIEWHNYDILQIAEKEIPVNGNDIKYKLKQTGYQGFERDYILGSGYNGLSVYPSAVANRALDCEKGFGFPQNTTLTIPTFNYNCDRGLGTHKTKDVLLYVSQALGTTFIPKASVVSNYVNLELNMSSIDKYPAGDNFITGDKYVIDFDNLYDYPEIESDYYDCARIVIKNSIIKKDSDGTNSKRNFSDTFTFSSSTKYFIVRNKDYVYSDASNHGSPTTWQIEVYGNSFKVFSINNATYSVSVQLTLLETEERTYLFNLVYGGGKYSFDIDNPLISKLLFSYSNITSYLQNWLVEGENLKCNYRYDPRLQLLDKILVKDKDGNIKHAVVEELEWQYQGSFKGKIKARTFTPNIIVPELISSVISENYQFVIKNNNAEDAVLYVRFSGGNVDTFNVSGGSSITIDRNNCPSLYYSVSAYMHQDLLDDVYCFFKIGNRYSSNTIILEEQ